MRGYCEISGRAKLGQTGDDAHIVPGWLEERGQPNSSIATN